MTDQGPSKSTYDNYAQEHSSPETPMREKLASFTRNNTDLPQMLSGPLQGAFLRMITKIHKPKRILEIGTFTGYSALCFAEGMDNGGEIITLDNDPKTKERTQAYFESAPNNVDIKLEIGDALDTIRSLPENHFDIVFIDADKENYLKYFESVFPLMRKGALLLIDNVFWDGKVFDENVQDASTQGIRKINQFLKGRKEMEKVMIPIRDGLMMVRKD